jgi:hypothetical protein
LLALKTVKEKLWQLLYKLLLLCLVTQLLPLPLVTWEFKMPAVSLSIFGGVGAQFFDNNGVPLSGGKIYTYEAGTSTPLATYTSSTGNTAHTNPIVLDSAGRVPSGEIWNALRLYKFVLKNSNDVLIATYDNVGSSFNATAIIANFTGDGSTVAFTLASAPAGENATNVYINGVYQQKNTYSIAGAVLTFSEAPPTTSSIEVNYV